MKRLMILAATGCLAGCNGSGTGTGIALPPVTMLSPDSANHQNARFSPDGKRLFWWEPAGLVMQLWTAGSDLSNPTKVPVTNINPGLLLWSPDGSQIAVASSDAGLQQLAVIPASGGVPRQLTHAIGLATPIGWNPDGDRITYVTSATGSGAGTFQSFVTSLKAGGSSALVPSETHGYVGAWSRDGSHIGIGEFEGSKNTIWVTDSAGRNPRQLTTDGFEQIGSSESTFSPDGKWIAYVSSRTGRSDIWIVPVDGGAPRQLTHDVRNDWFPLWSPDGKWISFMSDRGKQNDLWVVPVTGGEELRVTDDVASEDPMQWLSPTKIAYLTGIGQSGIWSISLADGSEKRLTSDTLRTGSPVLSPDGNQIAFRIDRGGGLGDIALMPAAGGPIRILVQGGYNQNLSWSPDGSRIAFQSDRAGTSDIWVADIAGGEPRQLVNWPGLESLTAWSPDGSAIYFMSDHDARLADVWKVSPTGGDPVRVTRNGSINNLVVRRGRAEIYVSIVNKSGLFEVMQVNPDGSLTSAWNRANSVPIDVAPAGDSMMIVAGNKEGAFSYRLVPTKGGGEGRLIFPAGGGHNNFSDDGKQILYQIQSGSTFDLGLLNRSDGSTRQLTRTTADEGGAVMSPDGKTVFFQRSRNIRRIAIADLSKLLASARKP